jgi:hypothetical protein
MKQKIYTIYYKESVVKDAGSLCVKNQEFITNSEETLLFYLKFLYHNEQFDYKDIKVFTNMKKWSNESVISYARIKTKRLKHKKNYKQIGSKCYSVKRKKRWGGLNS